MGCPTKNLGPISSAVLTFIAYKQTYRQAKYIYRCLQWFHSFDTYSSYFPKVMKKLLLFLLKERFYLTIVENEWRRWKINDHFENKRNKYFWTIKKWVILHSQTMNELNEKKVNTPISEYMDPGQTISTIDTIIYI